MMPASQVQIFIAEGIACEHLAVSGDGQHFEAVIVSPEFVGKNRVQRQQRVFAVVGERMEKNEIHALSMKCYTPDEWESLQA
ncbi:MAG TPA: BolA/IbaG family iron-sulfur metabolism protein [Rhodocyclaceae bacterium]|nr:BolA/IbaG family iron-sulfur metabolism protein [Rhodocyclaceae bacterium]